MGFFDTLRKVLGAEAETRPTPREVEARFLGVDPDELPLPDEPPFASGEYDRAQWLKKLKRVLGGLPATHPEWPDVLAESKAMGLDPEWLAATYRDEFAMLVRKAVADRVVTEAEHRRLDLARDLMAIPDAEAETILHAVVLEAESFFGGTVEGA
jgi:hypothetical protein